METKVIDYGPQTISGLPRQRDDHNGHLSAFSVAAPAGILVTVMGKDNQIAVALWNSAPFFIIAGSFFCFVAASLFYKERSDLAWFYGQISLVQARGYEESKLNEELTGWFKEADSWSTWWSYCCGFTFLLAGFAEYLIAIIFFAIHSHWGDLAGHLHTVKIGTFVAVPIVALFSCVLQSYVRVRYKYEDYVWSEFWRELIGRK